MGINLYADLGAFERRVLQSQTLSGDDAFEALRLLGAASRSVDVALNRKMYARTATRYVNGRGLACLDFDEDLLSVSALLVDEDGDRTYETTITSSEYELANLDAEDDTETPYNAIRLLDGASIGAFPRGRRRVKITGRWGYSDTVAAVLTSAGVAVTGTLSSSSDVTLETSAAASPEIAPGMTLRIESEDIYVVSGLVSPYVVQRGVNGTTAASHSAAAVSKYVYEDDVVGAVLMVTQRLWKRKDVPILPVIAAPGIGEMQLAGGLDPDIRIQLARLRHRTI